MFVPYAALILHLFTASFECYATQLKQRASSYPYISGDTFRAWCDHIFDETKVPFLPETVGLADTIFVKADMLEQFFAHMHKRIKNNYILVTHNSSYSVPRGYARWLDDPKIIAWFGQNIDRKHPKLFALPLGLENARWPRGNIRSIKLIQEKLPIKKDKLLYLNVSVNTNPKKRKPLVEFFKDASFCYNTKNRTHKQFLQDLATSFFVASPQGRGIDCHRTWEALYCNAIPIVTHSTIDELFEGLPVLIINNWQEITQEYLEEKYNQLCNKNLNNEKLYADYWLKKIKDIQITYRQKHE